MVQREVADRMLARPGTKDYSAFTVKLAYFCRPEKVMGVSRRAFMPPPNVDSTVVKLTRRAEPPVKLDRDKLFALITAGFSQRRKRLANAVGSAPVYRKEAVDQALGELGLAPDIRAERLDLADFGRLMEVLEKYNQAMH
jgi:16S rRNA (adenine1518-N6/adenine1519-N6)-dimethyltransferase